MTGDISMLSNLGMCIQQLLECVGPNSLGQANLKWTNKSLSDHSIDITLTVSCVRNSDTEVTMEASPQPSPSQPPSPSQSSSGFSANTSKHFLPMYDGRLGPTISYGSLVSLLLSQGVSVGSSGDARSPQPLGRLLLMIHKEAWLTS